MNRKNQFYRKRIIVFGFEGKNNKTETNYFSHFQPVDDRYIIKLVSCGVTDPVNMIHSIKVKRRDFDYNSKEDLTFLFVDGDCNEGKNQQINILKSKQPKDITIIKSNPCFELWILNHFVLTTKTYTNNEELINELKKYIAEYNKNKDYYDFLVNKTEIAKSHSMIQRTTDGCKSTTEVIDVVDKIVKRR